MKKLLLYSIITAVSINIFGGLVNSPLNAAAADNRNFNPELIISDSIFRQHDSMTAPQIQWFLESKNSKCLKDKYVLSLHDSDGDGLGDEPYGLGKSNKVRVSALIKQASRLYGINPRVILATLEKEQGLVTRQDCPSWRYNTALGYGCPDSQPCDNSAYGFTRQIDYGTWHFKGFYLDTYPVPPTVPGSKYIQYNPSSSCGGKTITIRNRATAALYSYTPYQPNPATIAARPGQTVPCGAYGNLNFWRYFTDWFGLPTTVKYEPMGQKRWLKLSKSLKKINLKTGRETGDTVAVGSEVYFVRKAYFNGITYLQTKHDFAAGVDRGIALKDTAEIPIEFSAMSAPRWMNTKSPTSKMQPVTGTVSGEAIATNVDAYYTSRFTVGDTTYLRTRHDTEKNVLRGIPLTKLNDANVRITPMSNPRWFEARKNSSYKDMTTGFTHGSTITKGTRVFFTHKMYVSGNLYLSTQDTQDFVVINSADFKPVLNGYVSLVNPRSMKLTQSTKKTDTFSTQLVGQEIQKDTVLKFTSKISVGEVWYLRTEHDSKANVNRGIPLTYLEELSE